MGSTARPETVSELQDLVRAAEADSTGLEIVGGGSKSHLGRKAAGEARPHLVVETSSLDGVVSYEPGELILVARPGLRLVEVESLLAQHQQHLAFEPPHWGESATVGGTVACGLSGPRRFTAGALRDFILGVEFIDGRGERIRAGGRVVKNVTGYDLSRTMAGSFGTLGVLTEICIKLWPRPQTERTLVVDGVNLEAAAESMLEWAQLPMEVTGLAYLPGDGSEGRLYARVEGSPLAVRIQIQDLKSGVAASRSSAVEEIGGDESVRFWRRLRELEYCVTNHEEQLWRLCPPPASALSLVERLKPDGLLRYVLDWGGGLVWATFANAAKPARIHAAAAELRATSWRLACGPNDPNDDAFSTLGTGERQVNERLKKALDPRGILNSGRMYRW